MVTPGAHAVLLLDQAGWHTTQKLVLPANITLPPCQHARQNSTRSILRQAQDEDLWQFIRENWLGNRIFASYEAILDHCCEAWNRLIDQPWRIASIGLRAWAHEC